MMHASAELFWMMLGCALNDSATFSEAARARFAETLMCGGKAADNGTDTVWGRWWRYHSYSDGMSGAGGDWGPHEAEVTCPKCLVAIDAALEKNL